LWQKLLGADERDHDFSSTGTSILAGRTRGPCRRIDTSNGDGNLLA
jgi:hypothetical protein